MNEHSLSQHMGAQPAKDCPHCAGSRTGRLIHMQNALETGTLCGVTYGAGESPAGDLGEVVTDDEEAEDVNCPGCLGGMTNA